MAPFQALTVLIAGIREPVQPAAFRTLFSPTEESKDPEKGRKRRSFPRNG